MNKIKELFKKKGTRHLATLVLIMPFLIVIVICGIKIYGEAKNLLSMAGDSGTEAVGDDYSINGGTFVLRDTATDIQKEYFKELKTMYEDSSSTATDEDKVVSTVKNFVADFYTFSNKQSQYDVGGMYFVYTPQRETIYIQARDQFYHYLTNYINEYGAENLLEVETVEATVTSAEFSYEGNYADSTTGENVCEEFSAWKVEATWTYATKEESTFKTSKYDTKGYFVVINNHERFEIVYAGDSEYQVGE